MMILWYVCPFILSTEREAGIDVVVVVIMFTAEGETGFAEHSIVLIILITEGEARSEPGPAFYCHFVVVDLV